MARVFSSETSLAQRRAALKTERRWLARLGPLEWAVAAALAVAGVVAWQTGRHPTGWLTAAAVAAILGAGHRWKIRLDESEGRALLSGEGGEERVAKLLAESLDNACVVFNDISLRSGLRSAQIDHLVVGPSGVLVIETKNWGGRIRGVAREAVWEQRRHPDRAPRRMDNPLRQNRRHVAVVRGFLDAAGLTDIPVRPVVVFSSPRVELDIETDPSTEPVLTCESVRGWLVADQAALPRLTAVDIEKVAARLSEAL